MRRPESVASMSVRSDSLGSTALRIAVIGAQTAEPESPRPYTVYRTVATYEGQCYERLIRYSEFQWFHKKLKFKDKTAVSKKFPKKKWTRKASLEDDVIEARQVLLNEFMREISRSELTPESEQYLFKLLKIGQYADGSGRVSDLRGSLQASFHKSDRGDRSARRRGPLGVVHEEGDEEGDKTKANGTELAAAATLTATSVAFPAISSNATTVLTEEERSAVGSQSRFRAESEIAMLAAPDSAISDESVRNDIGHGPQSNPRSAPHRSQSSSIPASAYSEMMLNRPQLKTAQSLPHGRHGKRVDFPVETPAAPASAPVAVDTTVAPADERPELDGRLSPEAKYRERINKHLGTISRLLSESEAETEDMESSHSIQPLLPMPLTA